MPDNQYVELLLKYKNQVTALICVFVALMCFIGGRLSVHVPPKQVVCEGELKTINKQFEQIKKLKEAHIVELRKCHDDEQMACNVKVANELEIYKKDHQPNFDCRVCKSLSVQCKKKGLW